MNMDLDKKQRVLIVDDDPFMQTLYRKALEREGFTIVTAMDGQAAVELLPTICVDLIVLDLMLPKIHGLKVLETIREDSAHKNLPVLILSNAYLPDVAQKAMKAKATSGILKSECSPKRLVKIIRELLKDSAPEENKKPAASNSWFSNLLGNKSESATPAAAPKAAESGAGEAATISEVQAELLKSWPVDIGAIRENCLKYVKSVGSQESEEHLKAIYRLLRLLSARATMGDCTKISQLSNALEAMLFEHGFNLKRNMSPSVVQTMVQAVDCLEFLFKTGRLATVPSSRRTRVLLVDDDAICNMVNDIALKRANFDTVCVADGVAALAILENRAFDLIFLDINMPVLSGFEVCEKLRKIPQCRDIPVIFVTLHGDFQSRAQGVLSGSNGFIAKPISPLELIVKALVFLLRTPERDTPREDPPSRPAVPANAEATKPAVVKAAPPAAATAQAKATVAAPIPLPAATAGTTEPIKLEGRAKELQATKEAVDDKVKALTEALALETKRREEAEQQAAEKARIQSKLEAAQAENLKAQEWLQQLMAESEQQSQDGDASQAWKADGRTRALEAVRSFVEDKVRNLTKALAVETEKSELAKQKVAEFAKRRQDFEAALAEIKQAKENLMREIEAAGNGAQRGELEAALAENQKSQAELMRKLAATQQEFQAEQGVQTTELSYIDEQTNQLKAAHSALEELKTQHATVNTQVQTLNQTLAVEASRRTAAEQQATELSARHEQLEQELGERTRAQEQLRAELAEHQQRLNAQIQTHQGEVTNLSTRLQELEVAQAELAELKSQHANVTSQVQSLNETLAAESGRRTAAEHQASELAARRTELEQELVQRTQTQEVLRAELAEYRHRLEGQAQTHSSELNDFTGRMKEFESAQAEIAELKKQLASVTAQVQSLNESLAAEAERRKAAEEKAAELLARRGELDQEVSKRTQSHEQWQTQLAEQKQQLEVQVQANRADRESLAARTRELEASQAILGALKSQHASVLVQIQSLTGSLAHESDRRAAAEQRSTELCSQRDELEKQLSRRSQGHDDLHAQINEYKQRLDEQVRIHNVELANLVASTKDLQASQVALVELKSQHAIVTAQVQALNESLIVENGRRATAEQNAAELSARRAELEQELTQRAQTHEQLRGELTQKQQQLDAQAQANSVDRSNLDARTKELAATEASLSTLTAQHASVKEQVKSLTESLAAEFDRRTKSEKAAAELTARRTELEQELAQRTQSQEQLRAELREKQQQLEAQVQTYNLELGNLAARTKELETAQAALVELQGQHASVTAQVQSLNETLTAETGRRTTAEQQATELGARRTELEQELAQRTQAHEQLRTELAEKQQRMETVSAELEELRGRSAAGELRQQQMAGELAEAAQVRSQLDEKLKATSELAAARESAIQALENELKSSRSESDALNAQIQAGLAQRQRLESQIANIQAQLEEVSGHLARKYADEQAWLGRESELKIQIRDQQDEIAKANAAVAARTEEIKRSREQIDEMQLSQSALCVKVLAITEQAQRLAESLTTETGRRTILEQTAAELTLRRAELEKELAERKQTLEQLYAKLDDKQKELQAQIQTNNIDRGNLAERTKELDVSQAALAELMTQHASVTAQVQSLTQSLAAETQSRTHFEHTAAELTLRRAELEKELAERKQTLEQLRADMATQQQELQAQIQTNNIDRGNLAERTKELEASQAALAELRTQHASVTAEVQSLTRSLAAETESRTKFERTAAELAAERAELAKKLAEETQAYKSLRAELDTQIENHNRDLRRLDERTRELENTEFALAELKTRHAAAEQAWTERETEMQNRLRTQQDQIAKSDAALTERENEIKNAGRKIEELQVLQSALCAKVQSLTQQGEAAAKAIEEWQTKTAQSENAVESVRRKLAGLHYSFLDASRLSARLGRERAQKEQQNLTSLQQQLASLAQTPLSLTQRGMLAELQNSMDAWKNVRVSPTKVEAFRVELPGLRDSHFCFADVTESAFHSVRTAAASGGVAVKVTALGITTGKLFGFAEHIHQLITLLATSPLHMMPEIKALELRVALEPKGARFAEMTVRAVFAAEQKATQILAQLNTVTTAAATLQSGEFTEAEFGLAAGWQLAQAMGARTVIEGLGANEVCLGLCLAIEIEPGFSSVSDTGEPVHVRNGNVGSNGNHHGNRISNQNDSHNDSHDGNNNGNHPYESRVEVENQ